MEKLELKQVLQYVPYKVEAEITWSPIAHQGVGKIRTEISKLSLKTVESIYDGEGRSIYLPSEDKGGLSKKYVPIKFKPILRPLSDLTKDAGSGFEYATLLWSRFPTLSLANDEDSINKLYLSILENPLKQRYDVIQVLFEWHFDVFGLIEKGLAIDVNTFTK